MNNSLPSRSIGEINQELKESGSKWYIEGPPHHRLKVFTRPVYEFKCPFNKPFKPEELKFWGEVDDDEKN